MKKLFIAATLFLVACQKQTPAPTPPPAPEIPPVIRSKRPSGLSQIIEHCIVVKSENENTVTCECEQIHTRIDAKSGRITIVCKAVREGAK
jgi:hypothetical protein